MVMLRKLREPVNGLTHLVGALLAVVALVVLICLARGVGQVRMLVGFTIFGASLIALYTSSALYHLLPVSARWVERLRRLDHMMIFVLIAGTYTPVCLVAPLGGWGWGMLTLIWTLALGGIALKIWWMRAPNWFSTLVYVIMGWLAVIATPALVRALPGRAIFWLIMGGVIYSVGALIFALERPRLRPGIFGAHELWHLFVLAGSGCHFWVMVRHIVPLAR